MNPIEPREIVNRYCKNDTWENCGTYVLFFTSMPQYAWVKPILFHCWIQVVASCSIHFCYLPWFPMISPVDYRVYLIFNANYRHEVTLHSTGMLQEHLVARHSRTGRARTSGAAKQSTAEVGHLPTAMKTLWILFTMVNSKSTWSKTLQNGNLLYRMLLLSYLHGNLTGIPWSMIHRIFGMSQHVCIYIYGIWRWLFTRKHQNSWYSLNNCCPSKEHTHMIWTYDMSRTLKDHLGNASKDLVSIHPLVLEIHYSH